MSVTWFGGGAQASPPPGPGVPPTSRQVSSAGDGYGELFLQSSKREVDPLFNLVRIQVRVVPQNRTSKSHQEGSGKARRLFLDRRRWGMKDIVVPSCGGTGLFRAYQVEYLLGKGLFLIEMFPPREGMHIRGITLKPVLDLHPCAGDPL